MQYFLTIYESTNDFNARDGEGTQDYWAGWGAYMNALREAGIAANGAALEPPASATTVRVKNGARTVHDGPYADTKEQIGGYFIMDFPTLDEALEWAARCPAAASGAVEVRPVLTRNAPSSHMVENRA